MGTFLSALKSSKVLLSSPPSAVNRILHGFSSYSQVNLISKRGEVHEQTRSIKELCVVRNNDSAFLFLFTNLQSIFYSRMFKEHCRSYLNFRLTKHCKLQACVFPERWNSESIKASRKT